MADKKVKTEAEIRAEIQAEFDKKEAVYKAQLEEASAKTSTSVPGLVEIELENADGDTKALKVGIADGYPNLRPLPGQAVVVKSADFMKLAMGKGLSEEAKANFVTLNLDQAAALDFLKKLVVAQSAMIKIVEPSKK